MLSALRVTVAAVFTLEIASENYQKLMGFWYQSKLKYLRREQNG
jgi:hypothetical protein